jgi:glycosyltransferase involved in cell wall biosynthesis
MARILVIASFTPSLILFRGDLLRALRDRGHEVTCCSPAPATPTLKQLAELGVTHRVFRLQRTGMNPVADWQAWRDLRRIMADWRPEHVLSYTIKPVIYGSLAAGRERVPGINAMITGLGTTFLDHGLRGALLNAYARTMYRAALRRCGTVFFQNPDDSEVFLERGLVQPGQVRLINGSGINLTRFSPAPVPDGPPVFLLIARLVKDKGLVEFAEAARRVKDRFPEARFLVAGFFDDHPRAVSRGQMDGWVASGVLEFLGPTADVRPLLQACSVYCLPSYREGTPRTVLEAMATGRAVITSDAPGCRQTVADGDNGFLVPVRDPAALAGAMEKFCTDPALAAVMGPRSRQLAERKFDVHRVNRDILAGMGLDQSD